MVARRDRAAGRALAVARASRTPRRTSSRTPAPTPVRRTGGKHLAVRRAARRGEPAGNVRALRADLFPDAHRTIERRVLDRARHSGPARARPAEADLARVQPPRRARLTVPRRPIMQIERGPEDAVAIDLPVEGVWFVPRRPEPARERPLRAARETQRARPLPGRRRKDASRWRRPARQLLRVSASGCTRRATARSRRWSTRARTPPSGTATSSTGGEHRRDRHRRRPVVLYAQLKQGSARVRVGDPSCPDRTSASSATRGTRTSRTCTSRCRARPRSRSGRRLETFPILFRDTIVIRDDVAHPRTNADVRRGDRVGGR